MTILELAQSSIPDLKRKTVKEWAGPCPECGGTDRFIVWTHRESWHCRGCDLSGDAIEFLRKFEGKSCPEAHAALGKSCTSITCAGREKCSQGEKPTSSEPKPLAPPQQRRDDWSPSEAVEPAELWQQKAVKFVDWAHEQLLGNEEQLVYLAGRGIPREAVVEYGLGWNPGENGRNAIFRERSAWGLPPKVSDGRKKKLWIPRGIVIPSCRDGQLQKVRIRRPKEDRDQIAIPYYALEGGGDDVPVFNPDERAFVVVEADLCGVATAWACRGIAGAIPLASCSVKPKTWAASVLGKALCILVSTDYDPETDQETGQYKNPGGKAARWWSKHYPNAERWPVPVGKDPGEAFEQGVDLREWILAGLPPAFHVKAAAPVKPEVQQESAAPPMPERPACPEPVHAVSRTGRPYILVHTRGQLSRMLEKHPDTAIVGAREIERIPPEIAEQVLMVKEVFPGAEVVA